MKIKEASGNDREDESETKKKPAEVKEERLFSDRPLGRFNMSFGKTAGKIFPTTECG